MWDTVWFKYEFAKQSMPVEDLFFSLCDSVAPAPYKGQGAYECYHKNMLILYVDRGQNNGYIMFQGSLSKYMYGNNIQTITTTDTHRAIEQLQDTFGLLFMDCPLQRLDVSNVINTLKEPTEYYPYLEGLSIGKDVYHKNVNTHSIYFDFSTPSRYRRMQIQFYDKVEEAKRHNIPVPTELEGLNLLRYEVRYLTPTTNFKRQILLSELTDIHFLELCFNDWKSIYNHITKKTSLFMPNYNEIKTYKDLQALAETVGYMVLGEAVIHKADWNNYQNKSRALDKYRDRISSKKNLYEDPIIKEITDKINGFELIELMS